MNAAGSLGFAPDWHGPVDLARFGAFVTNPISLRPHTPARGTRFQTFPGGFLMHTGYPNSGFKTVIRRQAARWMRSPLPVIVHLLAKSVSEVSRMVQRLETLEGVMAVELGLPPGMSPGAMSVFARAAVGELPVVVRLPLERAMGLDGTLAAALADSGIAAVSLGPSRGALPGPNIVHGRLYGPAMYPLALEAVSAVAETGIPVIGAGGVYHTRQVDAMLAAGAFAVQLDTCLWRGRGLE